MKEFKKPTLEEIEEINENNKKEKKRFELCLENKICPNCGNNLKKEIECSDDSMWDIDIDVNYSCNSCNFKHTEYV